MIKIDNITKVFNPHSRNRNQVLKGVSFELPEKGLICIYGKSGSGKTTLLNIIGGLDKQDGGKLVIDGKEVNKNVDTVRNQNIGFVFQNYYLEKGYTIAEIMHNAMVIAGFKDEKEIAKRSKEVLELVDMERFKNKQADSLSGGQKQRVAIARGLIKGADILLADEPTGNLDAENTMKIMDIFKEISKTKLVVIVTHEVTLIKKYADSYIQLVDGKLTDEDVIGEVFKYETEKNNIYVDKNSVKDVSSDGVNLEVYGSPTIKQGDIQIYEDNGKVFLTASPNVTILNSQSEKKLVFNDEKEETTSESKEIPTFSKSTSKRNGKLFTLKNIFKSQKNAGGEKAYSTANIFKQVFVMIISVVMCFLAMMSYEVVRVNVDSKTIDNSSTFININNYGKLKRLDQKLYENVDYFETCMKTGNFSYNDLTALSGIKINYVPKAIERDDTFETLGGKVTGEMPKENEVLITTELANRLKSELRMDELNDMDAMLLVLFENNFKVSGVVNGDTPAVYMLKQDYVNFLGVYSGVQFIDKRELFLSKDYINNAYSAEIVVMPSSSDYEVEEVYIDLNRNALYKMMPDIVQADFNVQKANSVLLGTEGRTDIALVNSKFYVRKLNVTRDSLKTDLRIYVHEDALDNIFVYLAPTTNAEQNKNIPAIRNEHYFEVKTKDATQKASLNSELSKEGIPTVKVADRYERAKNDAVKEATNNLTIFFVVIVLLYLVYFFIEKSGSLKNSKEYGIYRAIGVKKSNLLYKEAVLALFNNMIGYTISYIIVSILLCVRYSIMNVPVGAFIGILLAVYVVSSILMVAISLIPYLFVLFKTPSEILSRYDI